MKQVEQTLTWGFEDTEVAFAHRSDAELKRAVWLFRMMGWQLLAQLGPRLLQRALKLRVPVGPLIRRTLFAQFCGGEDAKQCLGLVGRLWHHGVSSILDYGVEAQDQEESFAEVIAEVLRNIDLAAREKAIPFCVFKPTGIAAFTDLEKLAAMTPEQRHDVAAMQQLRQRFTQLFERAAQQGVPLMVDAEESWIQAPVDELAEEMMRRFNKERAIVFTTVQMYRVDRLAYLQRLTALAEREGFFVGVKLVRGAYMEKERARAGKLGLPSPIHPDKAATDAAINAALEHCVAQFPRVALCAGTHNEWSSKYLAELMYRHRIRCDDPRICFSQLLGMSDHITFNLAKQGYQVAKYVPYGPIRDVMPYLLRRAEENSSVQGQSSRELLLLEAELERRRHPSAHAAKFRQHPV